MLDFIGNYVVIKDYADTNYVGNMENRRSHYSIIIYVNNALIIWCSKRHNMVEFSIFGTESVALITAIDIIEDFKYNLKGFGVPVDDPSYLFCDTK